MNISFTIKIAFASCGFLLLFSCKKSSVAPSFTATIGSSSFSFDSLFAYIDTSSASVNYYFVNIGAKDTKANKLIYIAGFNYSNRDFNGIYYYRASLPYPLPFPSEGLHETSVVLTGGQDSGRYTLGGNDVSYLTINKSDNYVLEGNFYITLNWLFDKGSVNYGKSLQMSGQFNIPYHFIP